MYEIEAVTVTFNLCVLTNTVHTNVAVVAVVEPRERVADGVLESSVSGGWLVLVCCICCTSTDQIVLMSPLFATEEGTSFVDNAVTLPKFTEVVSALNEAVRTPSDS